MHPSLKTLVPQLPHRPGSEVQVSWKSHLVGVANGEGVATYQVKASGAGAFVIENRRKQPQTKSK